MDHSSFKKERNRMREEFTVCVRGGENEVLGNVGRKLNIGLWSRFYVALVGELSKSRKVKKNLVAKIFFSFLPTCPPRGNTPTVPVYLLHM